MASSIPVLLRSNIFRKDNITYVKFQDSSADDENLEKELRKRALMSMRKKAAKESRDDSDEESSSD